MGTAANIYLKWLNTFFLYIKRDPKATSILSMPILSIEAAEFQAL